MDTENDPRWIVTYRLAGDDDDLTIISHADGMVAALKDAQMWLRDALPGKSFRITAISES